MAIVTFTSDLGDNSHYPAVVKGIILSLYPDVTLVDVTHNVPSFDIMQAAYVLRHTYHAFPAGSIHLISVDPESKGQAEGVVMAYDGHFFVGPNNGLMSLITNGAEAEASRISHPGLIREAYPRSFRAARLFAPA
ncbi:MAG: hypothetical protein D6722_12075, partial [Bacteroidetes bacterium]